MYIIIYSYIILGKYFGADCKEAQNVGFVYQQDIGFRAGAFEVDGWWRLVYYATKSVETQ